MRTKDTKKLHGWDDEKIYFWDEESGQEWRVSDEEKLYNQLVAISREYFKNTVNQRGHEK